MVRALLNGSKTQTRRAVKPQPETVTDKRIAPWDGPADALLRLLNQAGRPCPYGQPGDRLWVRETWAHGIHALAAMRDEDGPFVYAATDSVQHRLGEKWKPSIHMPRVASLITLEVTGVRVERLQDISDTDCVREGVTPAECTDCDGWVNAYSRLWESINGPDSWDANPWVWVIEFKRAVTA